MDKKVFTVNPNPNPACFESPKKVMHIHLRQHLVFSSSSQALARGSEILFRHSLLISKCLKLLETSSSSSSLELQFDTPKLNVVPSFSFAKWQSRNSPAFNELVGFIATNGPDLLAGVLCRGGDMLLKGVGHLEVVELPSGVISVPMSLLLNIEDSDESLNRKLSLNGSEHSNFKKFVSDSFVNLSVKSVAP